MVFITGEEMTRYAGELMFTQWVQPFVDTSAWEFFDLSCQSRDQTDDNVLHEAVAAGARVGAIFKEPTVTPTAEQVVSLGLKRAFGSPNGAMRKGWNGITISRDTIHIKGLELGFKKPVLFERHAVGGEYGAGWRQVGKGKLRMTFVPEGEDEETGKLVLDERHLTDENNVAVVYTNPYDNVYDLARIFFDRCLKHEVVPYVVTKKTVFKWQEGFWKVMKEVFDEEYKAEFRRKGLLERTGGELTHVISDAATMQILRWGEGGFGMACHNYDGDMLTDQVAQCHRSPGFITSNLIGKSDDGNLIKEFEASHGTVADMWDDHQAGRETSFNPLGMAEALIGAMIHAAELQKDSDIYDSQATAQFAENLRTHIHAAIVDGKGTRDISGPEGLTTEGFVAEVASRLEAAGGAKLFPAFFEPKETKRPPVDARTADIEAIRELFDRMDTERNGTLSLEEFEVGIAKLGVLPQMRKRIERLSEQE